MKTKLLIFSVFILTSFTVKAQYYYPLPDSNVTWIVQQDDGFGGFYYWEFYADTMNKDTIINFITYTKIVSGPNYRGACRSDTLGFTYFVPKDSVQEYLARDLTKNTGDTIKNIFTYTNLYPSLLIDLYVDSVNYVQAGPYNLKRMFLSNHSVFPQDYSFLVWIEKIGTNTYGPFNNINALGNGASWLYCMHYNDTIYYYNSYPYPPYVDPVYYFGQCSIPVDLDTYNIVPSRISVSPNPFSDKITIRFFNNNAICHVKIYNTLGQVLYNKKDILNTNEQTLDLEFLKPGIYFLTLYYSDNFYKTKIVKR